MNNPEDILLQFVEAFNSADVDRITDLYDENAVNHKVADDPVAGKPAIRKMFEEEFSTADMMCIFSFAEVLTS